MKKETKEKVKWFGLLIIAAITAIIIAFFFSTLLISFISKYLLE